MILALIAAITMAIQDALGTVMVMAEARDQGWLAGTLDALKWGVGITTTTISVTVLQGHSTSTKVLVILLVTIANVLGTKLGQIIGSHYVHDATTLTDRIARLEALNPVIHDPTPKEIQP